MIFRVHMMLLLDIFIWVLYLLNYPCIYFAANDTRMGGYDPIPKFRGLWV